MEFGQGGTGRGRLSLVSLMAVVSAFLIPGSPLPYVQQENPAWRSFAEAMNRASMALAHSDPDTIVVYSTQWIAVLDQLWQAQPRLKGMHVDENWHEFGELPYGITIDTELTAALIPITDTIGIRSKGVNYDAFPVDTGTIVAANFLNPESQRRMVITSNNVYHSWEITKELGRLTAQVAKEIGRKVAIVGVGGLSGSFFRNIIDIREDKIARESDDVWNNKILNLMKVGDSKTLYKLLPSYIEEAKVEMGFKHLAFILGGIDGQFSGATIYHYGPLYGAGGAVVEFHT